MIHLMGMAMVVMVCMFLSLLMYFQYYYQCLPLDFISFVVDFARKGSTMFNPNSFQLKAI